jgi:hypothetical protein
MSEWDGKERRRGSSRRRNSEDRRNAERTARDTVPRRDPERPGRRGTD